VLAFSSDGGYLATAAHEGEWVLGIWNTKTGARVRTLRGHDDTINGAAFLPDGSLASWSADGTLRLWNVQRGAIRRVFHAQELPLLVESPDAGAA
jgi:WD40 repeat protein